MFCVNLFCCDVARRVAVVLVCCVIVLLVCCVVVLLFVVRLSCWPVVLKVFFLVLSLCRVAGLLFCGVEVLCCCCVSNCCCFVVRCFVV